MSNVRSVRSTCVHHWMVDPEPADPDELWLTGTCKHCGSTSRWPRKVELNAQTAVFRGYRRNPKVDHAND